jgi:putative FmdB family regulatory protein
MPLYEYECIQCHRRTEKIQKFSDPELTVCPHCGGRLERTITAAAVSFKGGGWYKDLYSSPKPAASNPASSGESGGSGSASESSTASDSGGASTGSSDKPVAAPAPSAAPATTSATAAAPTKS